MVLAAGFAGIKLSRFTREAPVGPRKASGVRHLRGLGAARLSPRHVRSNGSGLLSSRPFTFIWPPSMASSNRSPSKTEEMVVTLQAWRTQIHSGCSTQMCYLLGSQCGGKVPWVLFCLMVLRMDQLLRRLSTHKMQFHLVTVSLAELYLCMYAHTDSPAPAEKAHSLPVALRLETFLWGPSQGSTGGSQGGGGLLEAGCAIQGGSALNGPALPSLVTKG